MSLLGQWLAVWQRESDEQLAAVAAEANALALRRLEAVGEGNPPAWTPQESLETGNLWRLWKTYDTDGPSQELNLGLLRGARILRPHVAAARWARFVSLEEALALSFGQGDLLCAALILRSQIEEVEFLSATIALEERIFQLESTSAESPHFSAELSSALRNYIPVVLRWFLPHVDEKQRTIWPKLTRLPKELPPNDARQARSSLASAYKVLNDYVHPNYRSHLAALEPDAPRIGLNILSSFVAVYKEAIRLRGIPPGYLLAAVAREEMDFTSADQAWLKLNQTVEDVKSTKYADAVAHALQIINAANAADHTSLFAERNPELWLKIAREWCNNENMAEAECRKCLSQFGLLWSGSGWPMFAFSRGLLQDWNEDSSIESSVTESGPNSQIAIQRIFDFSSLIQFECLSKAERYRNAALLLLGERNISAAAIFARSVIEALCTARYIRIQVAKTLEKLNTVDLEANGFHNPSTAPEQKFRLQHPKSRREIAAAIESLRCEVGSTFAVSKNDDVSFESEGKVLNDFSIDKFGSRVGALDMADLIIPEVAIAYNDLSNWVHGDVPRIVLAHSESLVASVTAEVLLVLAQLADAPGRVMDNALTGHIALSAKIGDPQKKVDAEILDHILWLTTRHFIDEPEKVSVALWDDKMTNGARASQRDKVEAKQYYADAVRVGRALVRKNERSHVFKDLLAQSLAELGYLHAEGRELEAAFAHFDEACNLSSEIHADKPATYVALQLSCDWFTAAAEIAFNLGRFDRAATLVNVAVERRKNAYRIDPTEKRADSLARTIGMADQIRDARPDGNFNTGN